MFVRLAAVIFPICACLAAAAETGVHACNAEPAIQAIYTAHRDTPDLTKALRDGLAAHPDNMFLSQWLIASPPARPGDFSAEFQAKLAAHPDEPLFLYLFGRALAGKDTVRSIRLIEQALAKDPEIPSAYVTLSGIYASPSFLDRAKLLLNLQAYVGRCPDDLTAYKHLSLVDDPAALRELAVRYRAAVEAHQAIGSVTQYPRLWAAEFRVADPKAYDKVRDRLRADMEKIRELDPSNRNDSRALAEGYRLLGDTAAASALRVNRTPPRNFYSVFDEWSKAHGQTTDYKQMLPASEQWVRDWPNETNAWYWRMLAIAYPKSATAPEIEKAGQDVLDSNAKTFIGWNANPYPLMVAEVWAEHDVRLKDCLGLLRQAEKELTGSGSSYDDRLPASAAPETSTSYTRFRILTAESLIDRKLKDYTAARIALEQMTAWISAHADDPNIKYQTMTWHDEAGALAEAEGHRPDALAHYQLGTQRDPFNARAEAVWTQMGGTPEGFVAWWKRSDPPPARP